MSTIQVAKSGMGFQSAGQRDGCKNCVHAEHKEVSVPIDPSFMSGWRCNKGGFMTSAMAICQKHQPAPSSRGAR
jgi:hypothetical protein